LPDDVRLHTYYTYALSPCEYDRLRRIFAQRMRGRNN
jgi:hypothetical protein